MVVGGSKCGDGMANYCVNRKALSTGYHEVHMDTCIFLPFEEDRLHLGEFGGSKSAVLEATKTYPKSKGCYFCIRIWDA